MDKWTTIKRANLRRSQLTEAAEAAGVKTPEDFIEFLSLAAAQPIPRKSPAAHLRNAAQPDTTFAVT